MPYKSLKRRRKYAKEYREKHRREINKKARKRYKRMPKKRKKAEIRKIVIRRTIKELLYNKYRRKRQNENAKWSKKNRKKINTGLRRLYAKSKRDRENRKVRAKTRYKYGKPPKGYQYHHTTKKYHIDKWALLSIKEHKKIRREEDKDRKKIQLLKKELQELTNKEDKKDGNRP